MRATRFPIAAVAVLSMLSCAVAQAETLSRQDRIAGQVIFNASNLDPNRDGPSDEQIEAYQEYLEDDSGRSFDYDSLDDPNAKHELNESSWSCRIKFLAKEDVARLSHERWKKRDAKLYKGEHEPSGALIFLRRIPHRKGLLNSVTFKRLRQGILLSMTVVRLPGESDDAAIQRATSRWKSFYADAERLGLFPSEPIKVIAIDANPLFTKVGVSELPSQEVETLAAMTPRRAGTVADGVSALLLMVEFDVSGEAVLSLADGADGKLVPLFKGTDAKSKAQQFKTRKLGKDRHLAFALYTPPAEFGTKVKGAIQRIEGEFIEVRDIEVKVQFTPRALDDSKPEPRFYAGKTRLARPPVVLVHGTYDNPKKCWETRWKDRVTLPERLQRRGFAVWLVDYTRTNGMSKVPDSCRIRVNRNVVYEPKVTKGGPTPRGGIKHAVDHFRDEKGVNFACTQADVVGHSLGGLLGRVWASSSDYYAGKVKEYRREDNFNKGDIHRLITLGTPHFGSDLSRFMVALFSIPKDQLTVPARVNRAKLWAGIEWMSGVVSGAAVDQVPESDALKGIGPTPAPSHAIALVTMPVDMHDFGGEYRESMLWVLKQFDKPEDFELYRKTFGAMQQQADVERLIDHMKRIEWQGVANLESNKPWLSGENATNDEELMLLFFRAAIFGNVANDCTVRVPSQWGGLSLKHRSTLCHVVHGKAPRYPHVQNRIIELLLGRQEAFDASGFPEAGQKMSNRMPGLQVVEKHEKLEPVSREEAIRRSNILADEDNNHAEAISRVAASRKTIIMVRPVNPDATRLIRQGMATKGMNIKGKSSDWGPHRGFIPVNQWFSKLGTKRSKYASDEAFRNEIASYSKKAVSSVTDKNATKTALKIDGKEVYGYVDEKNEPHVLIKDGDRYVEGEGEVAKTFSRDQLPESLERIEVLASKEGVPLTADYDLLAIGPLVPPSKRKMDDEMGFIALEEKALVRDVNKAVNHPGGDVVHHGPETSFPLSPGVDYPITAFEPSGAVIHIPPGPKMDPDRHLRAYYMQKREEGYLLPINAIWNWQNHWNCKKAKK